METQGLSIFFSYARADSRFVLKLAESLRSKGVAIWVDQLDIPAGARWDQSVEDALKSCQRLLIVLSPESIASQNVMDEVAFAIDQKKTVFPLLHRDCEIPFRLKRFQFIDFRDDYDKAVSKLLGALDKNTANSETKTSISSVSTVSFLTRANKRLSLTFASVALAVFVVFFWWNTIKERSLSPLSSPSQLSEPLAVTSADSYAQGAYPDIAGLWLNQASQANIIKQDGKRVSYDLNNSDYRHHAEGGFVNSNTIEMMQTRENIKSGCLTHVKLTLTLEHADEMIVRWENMDNNCDLKAGETGVTKVWKRKT